MGRIIEGDRLRRLPGTVVGLGCVVAGFALSAATDLVQFSVLGMSCGAIAGVLTFGPREKNQGSGSTADPEDRS